MFSRTRKHLTYTNLALTLALVFTMSGGAYAASKYVITSTKQISPKVLKTLTGKPGANGAAGLAGAQGPQGPQGTVGPQGSAGPEGAKGEAGTKGQAGATGPTGSPWPAGGTLPKGATETGEWSMTQFHKSGEFAGTTISFPIPLTEGLQGANVHFIKSGEPLPTGCTGNVNEPKAEEGQLCVFMGPIAINIPSGFGIATLAGTPGADTVGAKMSASAETEGEAIAVGSWAVTG
jgi:hypothetical protein